MIITLGLIVVIVVLIIKETNQVSLVMEERPEKEKDAVPTQEGGTIRPFILSKKQRDT